MKYFKVNYFHKLFECVENKLEKNNIVFNNKKNLLFKFINNVLISVAKFASSSSIKDV